MTALWRLILRIIRQILIKVGYFDLFSGVALRNLEKFDEAIIMYDRALKINPYDCTAYVNKGRRIDLF